MALPIDKVRELFPSLKQDQICFDNAGGTQLLGAAIDDVRNYLTNTNAQLGASYKGSRDSTQRYNEAFEAGAKYINATADEITYGPSTTQLLRNLSWTLHFAPGDEIIISAIDHESNISPWLDLAERQNLTVKWWKPSATINNPILDPKDLELLASHKTKLVACTHVSNVLGTITDIKTICTVAHSYGALVCVDGVAFAPHRQIDVKELGVDFYCFSWYKVYGPHISMLYARWDAQTQMKSLGHFFHSHITLTDKLGLSGASYELCQGIPSVVQYLTSSQLVTWQSITTQVEKLQKKLLEYLSSLENATVYGALESDATVRLPTISFAINGWNAQKFVEEIEKDSSCCIRWGSFSSNRLVRGILGCAQDGLIRVSMVHYNTEEEVDSLIGSISKVVIGTTDQDPGYITSSI